MTNTAIKSPQGVHLIGSIPLSSTEEVFRTVAEIIGDRVHRIPDGEIGHRRNWISWQRSFVASSPQLELVQFKSGRYGSGVQESFRINDEHRGEKLQFETLGYANAALESYQTFVRLQEAGSIPAHCRFQVSLPTPLATVVSFIVMDDQPLVEIGYTEAMERELAQILSSIPHDRLAIQWDVALEFAILEGIYPVNEMNKNKLAIIERLVRLGNSIPHDVELGYHLCYGDSNHHHFIEPQDTGLLVEVANSLSGGVQRVINWVHMPVPRGRTDEAYYLPLRQLQLGSETELYLGLLHITDGVEGTLQRISVAQRVIDTFGVATECGMGRRPDETIPALLQIHRAVSTPVQL
jgi:hypothetical protein